MSQLTNYSFKMCNYENEFQEHEIQSRMEKTSVCFVLMVSNRFILNK